MSFCKNFLYCDNASCALHHFKRYSVDERLQLSNLKTSMNDELKPFLAELKPGVPMCHFGDMCFHNTSDCKFNHWYVLDGRKKLKKAFSKQLQFDKVKTKIESDILDIKNGKKLIWADEC
jgi:hypothetical protein